MSNGFESAKHHRTDLLGIFANHRVAANLLMVIMLLVGVLALKKLNVQFFPSFELDIITISRSTEGIYRPTSARGFGTIRPPVDSRIRDKRPRY